MYDGGGIYLINRANKKSSYFTSSFPSGLLKLLSDRYERPSLKSIPVTCCAEERGRQIRPLAIQSGVDAEISIVVVSIQIDHLVSPSEAILIVFLLRDRVAPVGRGKPVVRVVHTERGSQTADHSTGTIWTAIGLLDTFDENVVIWRVLRELQYDLIRPVVHCLGERVILLGALLVRADFHLAIKLPPELEVDFRHTKAPNEVPCDKRIIELLSRVIGRKELRLGDELWIFQSLRN